jgi:hypothetical protein
MRRPRKGGFAIECMQDGWKALEMRCWSVRDGALTGESNPGNPCTSNQLIVWQGAQRFPAWATAVTHLPR